MLRTLGQQALRRIRQRQRRAAPPEAAGLREALLRGVYDQNRDAEHRAGAPRAGRRRSAGGPRPGLAIPLALVAVLATAVILAASNPRGLGLLGTPPPATAGPDLVLAPAPPPSPPPGRLALTADSAPPSPAAHTDDGTPGSLAEVTPLLAAKEDLKSLFGLSVKTIVVDAGHGGHDPGAVGRMGTLEKDVTLDIARRLKAKLEESGAYRVLLVRDGDVSVPLRERAAFANARPTDLFLSIHVNFLPGSATNAVEAYYFGRHRDARSRRVAERENQGSDYALSEFEDVLRNMQNALKLQEARALAHSIQGSMLAHIRADRQAVMDNGVRPAPFMVLSAVRAPAVLVEVGSLSSPEAERNLGREEYRERIASYVVAGIADHLDQQPPTEDHEHGKDEGRFAQRH